MKFSVIGHGQMANQHARVIHLLGHHIQSVVGHRADGDLASFAEKWSCKERFFDLGGYVQHEIDRGESEAIVVATPWNVTEKVLAKLLTLKIPMLVEKPIALSVGRLNKLTDLGGASLVFPAYNRRYYEFVPKLAKFVSENDIILVEATSSEPVARMLGRYGRKIERYLPHFYTTHIIDLLVYLLGPLKVHHARRLGNYLGTNCIMTFAAPRAGCSVQLTVMSDVSINSSINIHSQRKTAIMQPLERLRIYDGLVRIQENRDTQAEYLPQIQDEFNAGKAFKPGFEGQMRSFVDACQHVSNGMPQKWEELREVTRISDYMSTLVKS